MYKLTVIADGERQELAFEGEPLLDDVLERSGMRVAHLCGGRGVCGKCGVAVAGAVSPMNEAERRAGCRLSCQVRLLGDCEAALFKMREMTDISFAKGGIAGPVRGPDARYGVAADIGTTTLAVTLHERQTGTCAAHAGGENPQRAYAADVMGRIDAALKGRLETLQALIIQGLRALTLECCEAAGIAFDQVDALCVTGNTTMLYLLTGRDPQSLARAPFTADCLFGRWDLLLDRRAYLPPCMNAFVGADITCAALAAGLCERDVPALLCDIGTNGEIALWDGGTLWVASTAAGPAFEGACISCGVSGVPGAIDRVWREGNGVRCRTLGGAPAIGVCGSGLVDAVATFLNMGLIDESGALEGDRLTLTDGVSLCQADIRSVQLAKAAISAGIEALLGSARFSPQQVSALYLAGGFGSKINVKSAAAIGLLPFELAERTQVLGNAALAGAQMLLRDPEKIRKAERIAASARHVDLGGNPRFGELFIENMGFKAHLLLEKEHGA